MTKNTSRHSLDTRRIRQLLNRDLRTKYVADQIRIGIRNQLRSLRHERDLTQAALAELIGTKQSVISRIEKNPIRVGLSVYLDIANKLDVALVVRFEAIDTFVDWYDNLTPKKMTPDKSESILTDRAKELVLGTAPPLSVSVATEHIKPKPIGATQRLLGLQHAFPRSLFEEVDMEDVLDLGDLDRLRIQPRHQPLVQYEIR